jgi:hypothetical protein
VHRRRVVGTVSVCRLQRCFKYSVQSTGRVTWFRARFGSLVRFRRQVFGDTDSKLKIMELICALPVAEPP